MDSKTTQQQFIAGAPIHQPAKCGIIETVSAVWTDPQWCGYIEIIETSFDRYLVGVELVTNMEAAEMVETDYAPYRSYPVPEERIKDRIRGVKGEDVVGDLLLILSMNGVDVIPALRKSHCTRGNTQHWNIIRDVAVTVEEEMTARGVK